MDPMEPIRRYKGATAISCSAVLVEQSTGLTRHSTWLTERQRVDKETKNRQRTHKGAKGLKALQEPCKAQSPQKSLKGTYKGGHIRPL